MGFVSDVVRRTRHGLVLLLGLLLCTGFTVGVTASPARAADVPCQLYATAPNRLADLAVKAACAEVAAGTMYTWGGGHGARPGKTYGYFDGQDEASRHDDTVLGFDCSGFVRYAWSQAVGYDIVGSGATGNEVKVLTSPTAHNTVIYGPGGLEPGDIVFFGDKHWYGDSIEHVAISLGGDRIAEAAQSGTPLHARVLNADKFVMAIRINPDTVGQPGPDPSASGPVHSTWGTWIRLGEQPVHGARVVAVLDGPTQVKVNCQQRGDSITAEGTTNDWWSYLPEYRGWITNIYLQGPAVLPDVPECGTGRDLSGVSGTPSGGDFSVWASDVNVRAGASLDGSPVATIATPRSVRISCQAHGGVVQAEGYVNDVWSYLPDYQGWVSNIYLQGPAVLPVPECGSASGTPAPATTCTDGTDPTGSDARTPAGRSVEIQGRLIELRYSDSTECGWGRISRGGVGDHIWVDRSADGGAHWESQLGHTTITDGQDVHTVQWRDSGVVMRACGSVAGQPDVVCTTWF
ncbi:C40 family peptidase [Streptomyces roseirectus]|uniref:C40 family peptidase n=1 Tax=Streptomyces roseirectus TaxID=2768066 RepID=A0A7H0IN44_9ACTN|nr:NlpC/P60 family protein [Streptomyces roseirectus]QNP74210.1 C40 family peptidase [Streptomyces roseirectus]